MASLEKLNALLAHNYEAIGWKLIRNELFRPEHHGVVMRGQIQCPCGGQEYFSMLVDEVSFLEAGALERLAVHILNSTASRRHLESDVAEGLLPALDVDKHSFKGVLLEP